MTSVLSSTALREAALAFLLLISAAAVWALRRSRGHKDRPTTAGAPPRWARLLIQPLASQSRRHVVPSFPVTLTVLATVIVGTTLAWAKHATPASTSAQTSAHEPPSATASRIIDVQAGPLTDRSGTSAQATDVITTTPDDQASAGGVEASASLDAPDTIDASSDGAQAMPDEPLPQPVAASNPINDPILNLDALNGDPEVLTMPDGTQFRLVNQWGSRSPSIQVQDRDDARVRSSIGTHGSEPGTFSYPCALALDPDGNIVVADFGNGRVHVMTAYGTFVRSFGTPGVGPGELLGPCGLAVDSQGRVYVADALSTRVQLFDQTGHVIGQWGSATEEPITYQADGRLHEPTEMFRRPATVVVSGDTLAVVRRAYGGDGTEADPQWRYRLEEMTPSETVPAAAPPTQALDLMTYDGFVSHPNWVPAPYVRRLRAIFRDPAGMNPGVHFSGAFVLRSPTAPGREALLAAFPTGGNAGYVDFAVWRPGEEKAVWSITWPGYMFPTDRPATFAIASRFSFQYEMKQYTRLQYVQFFEWDGVTVRALPERRIGEFDLMVRRPVLEVPDHVPWPVDDDPNWVPWADDVPRLQTDR